MQTVHRSAFSLRRTAADTAAAAVLLTACILLILYRTEAHDGILSGVYTCLNALVPSLFPFVLFACVLTNSRTAAFLFRPLGPIMRFVFRLPACAAPALLFGLTMGYPVGAKITASIYTDNRLNRTQTARLLCFCTSPGYAFSLYAGTQLTGSTHSGLLLFFSCAAAPLLFGLILSLFSSRPAPQPDLPPTVHTFADSVREGTSAMVTMCSFLVLFSSAIAVLQSAGVFRTAAALLSRFGLTVPAADTALRFLLEVTSGTAHCAYWHLSPALAAFGLGFGGLCIHLQLFSFFRSKPFPLSLPLYLLTRFLNGMLCCAIYSVLSRLFPLAAETVAGSTPVPAVSNNDPSLSAALLALSLFFLFVCASQNSVSKRHPYI